MRALRDGPVPALRRIAEAGMTHAVTFTDTPTVTDDTTGIDQPGAPVTVWAGPCAYTPAGTRAAALAAARGARATGTLRLPVGAVVWVGLTGAVTGVDADGVGFALLVRVTDVRGRPGRRIQQTAAVEDLDLDPATPAGAL
jgi:hypothetical protein